MCRVTAFSSSALVWGAVTTTVLQIITRRRLRVQRGQNEALVDLQLGDLTQTVGRDVQVVVIQLIEPRDTHQLPGDVVGPAVVGTHKVLDVEPELVPIVKVRRLPVQRSAISPISYPSLPSSILLRLRSFEPKKPATLSRLSFLL
jgi:hypothetical protein